MARTAGYSSPIEFYVEKLVEGISTLAAAFADKPVIVRMSDFKWNKYADLIGGKSYEPEEKTQCLVSVALAVMFLTISVTVLNLNAVH